MDASSILHRWDDIDFKVVLAIVITAWVLMWFVRMTLRGLTRLLPVSWRVFVLPWIPACRFAILVGAIALAAPHVVHTSAENVLAILGAIGLALGFAVKDYVASVIAGIVTLFERDYRVGDWIEFGGHFGEVKKIGFRAVHLVTVDDNEIIVPHANLLTSTVVNATSGNLGLQCTADFFLDPDHDADQAHKILLDIAKASELAAQEPPVVVAVKEIPGATRYTVRVYAKDSRAQYKLKTETTLRGKVHLRAAGIKSASFPYTVSTSV